MARIMGIDYGTKRTGLAVTDPLQIIVSPLETVPTSTIFEHLTDYLQREEVEKIVVGDPMYPDGNPAQIAHLVVGFRRKLQKLFPQVAVIAWDERYTTEEAKRVVFASGVGKKKRRDKSLVDKVSAALILEDYMREHHW